MVVMVNHKQNKVEKEINEWHQKGQGSKFRAIIRVSSLNTFVASVLSDDDLRFALRTQKTPPSPTQDLLIPHFLNSHYRQ
jgi:hypothetical protein